MLYFLFGEDRFRLLQEEKTQIEKALKKGYAFVEQNPLDAKDLDFSVFWNLLSQKSFFSSNKVIVLRNVLENEEFKKQFFKKIEDISSFEDVFILSQPSKVKPSESLLKKLKKIGAKIEEFSPLEGQALNAWIKKEALSLGANIDIFSINSLINFCSVDLFCLSSEIKKLACFSDKIDKESLKTLSFQRGEINIFETIDSLAQKNKKKALSLLQEHLNKGENPLYLLSMFAYQIRNLILVKQFFPLGAFKLGISPFVFRKLAPLRDNFSFDELKKFFFALFEVDYKIKTGKILPEQALFDLIGLV
ncbi:MAG: DNA polymerase III subunit delta [bacterium]|nr:DNA polymerase III subunit delta [bacterium]